MWDIDLMDMTSLSAKNDGVKHVLVAIDVFSRYVWCVPLKAKTSAQVKRAFQTIFREPRRPKSIRTDKGRELNNREIKTFLKTKNIHQFASQNTETKANYAERVIKTIKHKLFRYLLENNTERYVDALNDIVRSYNGTIHQSLGRTPASINRGNERESRLEQYRIRNDEEKTKKKKFKLKVGQIVRLSHVRHVFDREYSQKWTGELFKIRSRFRRAGLPMYRVDDWCGEPIEGSMYESELQAVNVDESTEYRIEKILKKRNRKKKGEVLVRWLHWPKKYDSWIPESSVKDYS